MKLAHVNFKPSLGVFHKIVGQAAAAKRLGIDMDFFVLSDNIQSDNPNVLVRRINYPKKWFFRRLAANFFRYYFINRALDLSAYDKVILRYPGSDALFYSFFFRKYKNKIILEHHSDVIEELKVIEEGVLNPLRIFLERCNSHKLHSQAAGIIGVTDELRKRYSKLVDDSVPSCVVSNGIDVEQVPLTGSKRFSPGKGLNMIFVSSTFYPWHGLDRLIKGLTLYQGDEKLKLLVIGRLYRKEELDLILTFTHKNVQIDIMSPQKNKKLDDLYRESHLAVSSLAIFRNNMKEACVLKTREYTARGIPFIYAYEDVDLDESCEFALKMEISDRPLDIHAIVDFAWRVSKIENFSQKMRMYAFDRIDWKKKIREMYQFTVALNEKSQNA